MSLLQTILGSTQRVQFIQSTTGTVISIDCTVKEIHKIDSPPTEYPVEDGTTISDNVLLKPATLDIEGIISDAPISLIQSLVSTGISHFLPPIGVLGASVGVALFNALSKSESPSVVAFGQLLELQQSRTPFDVVTRLKRYESMWIKSLSVPRDATTGKTLQFTVNLVQIILVSPQMINIQRFKNSDLSASEANKGKQEFLTSGFEKGVQKFNSLVR